jgi:replicative DNA helicase
MFIHREEYYNPETEKQGIAELIIAKHRKGPIGIAELGWLSECTRFIDIQQLERRL